MANVVEKDFVWNFIDRASSGIKQVHDEFSQLVNLMKSGVGAAQESSDSMANFGNKMQSMAEKVNSATNETKDNINKVKESLDGLPNDKKVGIETKAELGGANEAKEKINEIPKSKSVSIQAQANEFLDKVRNSKEAIKTIPKNIKTELMAIAKEQGINNFSEKLKALPKEKQISLVAKLANNDIAGFKKEIEAIPKKHETEMTGKGNKAPIQQFKEQIHDIPTEHNTQLKANPTGEPKIKRFTEALKGTAIGMGVYNAAMKVGSAVSEQFSSAIDRYDQLNRFPKVLEDMGASAKDANGSVKILSKGIDGLPTSLNEIESASQRFMPITNNAKLAAKSAVALNDALISSGATAADASDGLKEWTEMLDEGKPKMAQWQELTRVMSPALQKVAKSFGIASGSTSELYKKLQSGQITMKQLNDKMLQLDKGTKGFSASAHNATAGIGTAFANLKIRVTKALADALSGFDNFVKAVSGRSIAQNINNLSSHFSDFGKKAKQAFSGLSSTIKKLTPVFTIFGSYIKGVFVGAIQPIKDVGKALENMLNSAKHNSALAGVSKSLDNIAEHKKAIEDVGKAVSTFITVLIGARVLKSTFSMIGKGLGVFTTLTKVVKNIKSFQGALVLMQFGLKNAFKALGGWPTLIAAVITAFVELYKHSAKFRKFCNDIVNGAKSFAKNLPKNFKIAFDNIGKFFKGTTKWQKDFTNNLEKIGKSISKTVKGWDKDIKKGFDTIGKEIAKYTKPWVKPVKDAFDKIGKTMAPDIDKWKKNISKGFKSIERTISKSNAKNSKAIGKFTNNTTKEFDKWSSGVSEKVNEAFNKISKNVSSFMSKIGKEIDKGMNVVSKYWNAGWEVVSKISSSIFKAIWNTIKNIMKDIQVIITTSIKAIQIIWKSIWDAIGDVFKITWDGIFHHSKVITEIKNLINTETKNIKNLWTTVWNAIKTIFDGVWNSIKSIANGAIHFVARVINDVIHGIQNVWNSVWNAISNFFNMIWNTMKNIASNAINTVRNVISSTLNAIQSIWQSIWNAISSFLNGVWNGIQSATSGAMNAVHSTISNILDRIDSVWTSMWNKMTDFFHGIWGKIKRYAAEGINGVLNVINAGIDGIDSVWKFFTGHETSIHHLRPVHFAQGGIVDRQLSVVNDGAGSHWKELIEEPDGNLFMAQSRNAVLPLKAGTRVYSGEETHQIMSALGVHHYATGGVVGNLPHYADGGIIDWASHELKDIGSWIKDKWDAISKFLKDPVSNVKALLKKAITKPLESISNSNMVALGKGVFDKLTQPIADWMKKGLEKAKEEHDAKSVGGFGNIPDVVDGQNLKDLVKKALEANGLSTSDDMIAKIMRQIATESGGNAHAVQPGADPDGDGSGPALGLMQTKRGTFEQYKAPGHDDIFNAYDNLLAALNYAKHTYGPSLYFLGQGHGYAMGGHILTPEYAMLGENAQHSEFVINPYAPSARPLLREAMHETNMAQPETTTQSSSSANNESGIGERIIALLEAILAKDTNVELESNSDKLRKHDAQLLRMINLQKGM